MDGSMVVTVAHLATALERVEEELVRIGDKLAEIVRALDYLSTAARR